MPTLSLPVTGVRSSFLAAMEELRAEGRGSPSENTMVGRDLREWTGHWESAEGFSTFVSYLLVVGPFPDEGRRPLSPPTPGPGAAL